MKICIVSGNPKTEGLCHGVIEAVKAGALEGGAEVDEINLRDYSMGHCMVCGNGWGKCKTDSYCIYGSDGFDEARERIRLSDAAILATPVYCGECSDSLKAFLDRIRRCDIFKQGVLFEKQTLLIASAGGSGRGLLTCFEQMERFCRNTGAVVFDYVGVNRWNSDYKYLDAKAAGHALASGRKSGDTIR